MTTPTTGRHRGNGRASRTSLRARKRTRTRTPPRARTTVFARWRVPRWDPGVLIFVGVVTVVVLATVWALLAVTR